MKLQDVKTKLEISQTLFEEKKKRVIVSEDVYQNAKLNYWKLDSMINEAQKEISSLEREQRSIVCQVIEMQKGDSMSIWPKPILHQTINPPTCDFAINVKPYGFCKKCYHCWDVTITLCKHRYHPFCLDELVKQQNRCLVCEQVFHPNWWCSWGFGDEDDEVRSLGVKLGLEEQYEEIKQLLKENWTHHDLSKSKCIQILVLSSGTKLSL